MRYAFRRLLHAPGFSVIVILTLAVGIGANSAIFSIVNAVLLRPQPYPEPDRLVVLNHYYPDLDGLMASFAVPSYRDVQERMRIFESFAVAQDWAANLTGQGDPERLVGRRVSGEYFRVFGIPAALGRAIAPGEDSAGQALVAVLSHGLWTRRFGADPAIVGKRILLNGEPFDVVGVMPAGFRDFFQPRAEIWAPVVFQPEHYSDDSRTSEFLQAAGRLRQGVTVEQAGRDVTAFAEQLRRDFPGAYPERWTIDTRSLAEVATGRIRPALLVLLGAVGIVLLIVCANVANLLLARAAARSREIAIRAAIGATQVRLVRQLLAESLLLSMLGAAFGLLLAYAAVRTLVGLSPPDLLQTAVALDGTVLLFTLALAVLTALLFGIAPAVQASRTDLQNSLKEGARTAGDRGGAYLRKALVVAEVALALSLLVGAGLLIRSFASLQQVDPGFDPANLVTMSVALPSATYETPESRILFFQSLLPRVRALPGVVDAGATSNIPFGGNWSTGSFTVEGYQPPQGQPPPWGDLRVVTPGFHQAMRIRLLAGRHIAEQDRADGPRVVVVDEEMVRRYWPDSDPLGKRIAFDVTEGAEPEWITVVGVVAHTAHEGLDAERRVQLYFSHTQAPIPFMTLAVRTAADPGGIVSAVKAAVRAVDPDQPIADARTMVEMMSRTAGQRQLSTYLLAAFAGIALLLAALGVYGVMSFDVARRASEMGVRMALGADRRTVLALVMRQGAVLAAVGIVLGVAGALALTRVLRSQLFGVEPSDPLTFGVVAASLGAVALLATLVPALRATRVNPVEALRYE